MSFWTTCGLSEQLQFIEKTLNVKREHFRHFQVLPFKSKYRNDSVKQGYNSVLLNRKFDLKFVIEIRFLQDSSSDNDPA